jgi:hypothetical protein
MGDVISIFPHLVGCELPEMRMSENMRHGRIELARNVVYSNSNRFETGNGTAGTVQKG